MMRFLIVLFLLIPLLSFSQQKHEIKVIAKYKNNKMLLRWAPVDPYVWQLGIKYGYTIERFNLLAGGKLNDQAAPVGQLLTPTPLKPYSKEAFDELIKTEEKAEVVQEIIYGETSQSSYNDNSPAAILKKNQDLENRFGVALFVCDMSTKVATAAGLMWTDENIIKGTRYIYRISLGKIPASAKVDPGVVVIDVGEEKPLPVPEKLDVKFTDHQATLSWPVLFHRGLYTAYIIERSTDGKSFKSLTDLPYANASEKANPENSYYVDSLPENHKTYYYRIKGISPFGETGPVSETVSGSGHKTLDGIVSIDSSAAIDNKKIFLSWSIPLAYSKLIKGFFVERSVHPDGPYKVLNAKILPVSQTSYLDEKATNNNYYRLKYQAKDKEDPYYSFPYLAQLMDTIPPAPPTDIIGKVDSAGVVTLTWKVSQESDILGYRVFRANSLREEFVEETRVILNKPLFADTINIQTLTKKVFYKVVAVDNYYNPSDYSAPYSLKRPDIVPPSPPVFIVTERKGEAIELVWQNSISADISKYLLFRSQKGGDSLIRIKEWSSNENISSFRDSLAVLGNSYKYILHAMDSAGNYAKASSKEVFFETGIRKAVTKIKTNVDRVNNKIVIEWKYDEPNAAKCIIYKAREGEPTKIYKTLAGDANRFEDKDLSVNNTYIYKIKVYIKGGANSMLSDEIKVKY